jgi:hypothetical protein
LLECIGFPPDQDFEALCEAVRRGGEPVALRGPGGEHLRLELAHGLELRLDREEGQGFTTLLPYFHVPHRLRVATLSVSPVEDSAFDALLHGWADPPLAGEPGAGRAQGSYRLATWLTDARRLPAHLPSGHVLAISVAGFALGVEYVGPDEGARDPDILELSAGAFIEPLGGEDDPGGCSWISARVLSVRHLENRLSGRKVDLLEVDAPGRPLVLFLSPWALESEGFDRPRPGWRIEGTFLFSGRIAGGLPGPRQKVRERFG